MICYAVFDLDKTMTKRGTWGRFVSKAVAGRPDKFLSIWLAALRQQLRYKSGNIERIGVKRSMLKRSLSGMSRRDLTKLAKEFAEKEVSSGLKPGFIRELEKRRQAGDRIIVASAGADLIVEAICERLGIVHVVCTELAWDQDICQPVFSSPNCYGQGKLDRLSSLLNAFDDFDRETAHVTVYSDCHSDEPSFNYADRCVVVDGTDKLKKMAKTRGWDVVDWSK